MRQVLVDTEQSGWAASIYVSDKPTGELTTLDAWGDARADGSDLDVHKTFETGGVKGRSVLLWLTQLPVNENNSGESKHFLDVTEVRIA